jgi:uncharacterized protein (DUF302 family)
MIEQLTRYGISTLVDLPYEQAVERTRESLGKEGFGVLTEIDEKQRSRRNWMRTSGRTSFLAPAIRRLLIER